MVNRPFTQLTNYDFGVRVTSAKGERHLRRFPDTFLANGDSVLLLVGSVFFGGSEKGHCGREQESSWALALEQQHGLDVRQDTTLGDCHAVQQFVHLIVANCSLPREQHDLALARVFPPPLPRPICLHFAHNEEPKDKQEIKILKNKSRFTGRLKCRTSQHRLRCGIS